MNNINHHKTKQYFNQPGFSRLLEKIWKKYASLGRAGGKVVVDNLSQAECEAMNGFLGLFNKSGDTVEISLKRFENELSYSPFPSSIPELYLVLAGKPLILLLEECQTSCYNLH